MASTVKHLRSSTANKRPTASGLADGQLGINTASGTPGVFFKDSAGTVTKVGPAHVGSTAPNVSPAGSAGNSLGELWVNNSTTINGLNYYTGSAFVNLTPSGTATVAGLVELATDAETQTGTDIVRAVTPSGLQSKISNSISTTSSTTIASATAVKTAYDLANAALPKSGGRVTGALEIGPVGSLVFEGSSDDSFETTLAVVNPTAARTITFPNVTGTVVTTGDSNTVTGTMIAATTITNAEISASAAIALSKLATGALPTGITIASGNIVDGTIVNADINASAAIAGTKISPNFGSQDITIGDKIIHDGDTNTAIRFPAADTIAFETNGSERARIDSSGRLLVGTSTSQGGNASFQVGGNSSLGAATTSAINAFGFDARLRLTRATTGSPITTVADGNLIGQIAFDGYDGAAYIEAARISTAVDGTPGANDMPGRLVFSTTADGSASPTEAMRINNAQELLIGYTADNGAYKLQVNSQIFATSATVATSDGRYKENVATLNGCIDLVNALRPVSFDWKPQQDITRIDEEGKSVLVREGHNFPNGKQVGFIAQEVQAVLTDKPWLGSVIKQNVRSAIEDADGNELAPEEEFFGIAEGNLIAVLTAALQEAIAKIDALEARIAALEA
jgi:hypothetical protein